MPPSSIRARKNALRSELSARRAALSPAYVEEANDAIRRQVVRLCRQHPTHQNLFLFAGIRQEPELVPLLAEPALAAMHMALPAVLDAETMEYRDVKTGDAFAQGRFGIREPGPDAPRREADALTIVLIPALAFSETGGRLGYGGGFYDRYLATRPQALRVGVCFDDFLLPRLPVSVHDVPVHYVLTDRRLVRVH